MGELDSRVAIVTGAATGIGLGIARVLAREGAKVVITDLDGDRAAVRAAELGGDTTSVQHDVADEGSCAAAVQHAVDTFGRVDVLVNNAGIVERLQFPKIERADWERMFEVNVTGVYQMTRAALTIMLPQQAGAVINVASIVGKVGTPNHAHYASSKFAVIGLTQSLALELAPQGVRVNAVCPGLVRTESWDALLVKKASDDGTTEQEAWASMVAGTPLGRPQDPEDVGEAVSFLASDRAKNITGIGLNVAGGKEMR
jgi:meso-butanediol dehydrogenase / (S,S)-butanediol dehydrogenase / diacetyl reductase